MSRASHQRKKRRNPFSIVAAILSVTALVLTGVAGLMSPAQATGLKDISAKALSDHGCNSEEWHFVITQVDSQSHAPSKIHVVWDNGAASADVPLDKFTGGTAHYATTANLDKVVTSATTHIYWSWKGQFNLSHGPCPSEDVEVTPPQPSFNDVCDTDNDTYTIPSTEGVTYKVNGHTTPAGTYPGSGKVTVTAKALEGYKLKDYTGPWTHTFTNEPCQPEDVEVAPVVPGFADCPNELAVPTVEGVQYLVNGEPVDGGVLTMEPGDVVVTAVAEEGYKLKDYTGPWTHTYNKCAPGTKEVTPAKPTATKPSCDNLVMTVTPSSQDGVIWSPSGKTNLEPGESVTYTASPDEGYAFPEDAETSWTFVNDFSEVCLGPPPVVVTHHPKPKPKPTTEPTPTAFADTGWTDDTAQAMQQTDSSARSMVLMAAGLSLVLSIGSFGVGIITRRRQGGAR